MSESREVFEAIAYQNKWNINKDRDGNYLDDFVNGAWWAWQAQQAKVDECLFDLEQKSLELREDIDGYKDPVAICQSEGVDIAICILKKALRGGQ